MPAMMTVMTSQFQKPPRLSSVTQVQVEFVLIW
jgi:hypothetical protein